VRMGKHQKLWRNLIKRRSPMAELLQDDPRCSSPPGVPEAAAPPGVGCRCDRYEDPT
jgi:hypothetical protein